MGDGVVVRHVDEVAPVACPCGEAQRIITGEDNALLSIHRVKIRGEAKLHYHNRLTEYYVVLEGEGEIEVGGASNLVRHAVRPGTVVMIPPGTHHALRGNFEIINIVTPPFDAADEHLAE